MVIFFTCTVNNHLLSSIDIEDVEWIFNALLIQILNYFLLKLILLILEVYLNAYIVN